MIDQHLEKSVQKLLLFGLVKGGELTVMAVYHYEAETGQTTVLDNGNCIMPTDITPPALEVPVTLRTELKPGDIGWIVYAHGMIYSRERGFDHTFEAYVAGTLAEFVRHVSERNQIWIAEQGERNVGCIAIVEASPQTAQLRWFLVEPIARGNGLGKKLLREAIAFCKRCGYESIVLWTVSQLTTAAHLYQSAGFKKIEEIPGRHWGVDVFEEKYLFEF